MATFIQVVINEQNGVSTIDAVMASITAGSKVVVGVKCGVDFTPATSQITDTLSGDAWTLDWDASAATAGVGSLADYAFFSKTFSSGGACTITFNPSAGSARLGIVAWEYSGLGAHDGSTRSLTLLTNSGTPTSGSFTPSAANGVIFGIVSSVNAQSWEADYTRAQSSNRFHAAVDESVTAASQAADTTQTATNWDCGAIWYPDAGGGGGGTGSVGSKGMKTVSSPSHQIQRHFKE